MSVWVCSPSARENGGTFGQWAAMGYKLCVWRDPGAPPIEADHVITGEWKGVYFAANRCFEWAFANDADCSWCVFAGDDTTPDPNKSPDEIAEELTSPFGGTFAVMQPVGDPWSDHQGRIIERIAGSPWVGREFARRINQGRGVFWEDYRHNGADEELWHVAKRLGVYWERPDLTHFHNHWCRPNPGERVACNRRPPKFLEYANSPEDWKLYKQIFGERKRMGFPGSEPL